MNLPVISDIYEIDKYIAKMLVEQSQLDTNRIINGLSIRGVELAKFIEDSIELSYNIKDSVIIFERFSEDNENINFSEELSISNIRQTMYHKIHIIIYGMKSAMLANILRARCISENVEDSLSTVGIYLSSVSQVSSMNEFINNTVWPRADFDIYTCSEIEVSQLLDSNQIDTIDNATYYTDDK